MPDQPPRLTLDDVLTPKARQRRAARRGRLEAAHRQLDALDGPLTRAVLDLHHPDEDGNCGGCDFFGCEAERPAWPCRTVNTVAAHHGIALPA